MCFSEKLSLGSLMFGIFSSLILISFGNKQSFQTNKAIGYFFLFVSLMQLVEYFIWKDIKCETGLNHFGALVGPLLNHLQPVVLLILATWYLDSSNLIQQDTLVSANILYLIYVGYKYYKYVSVKSNMCVQTNQCNHLNWTWKNDFNYTFYFIISFINLANFYTNTNLMVSFGIGYLLLLVSIFEFNQNVGEFWCLMVTGIPLINLLMEKI